jgi:hypothetical protein
MAGALSQFVRRQPALLSERWEDKQQEEDAPVLHREDGAMTQEGEEAPRLLSCGRVDHGWLVGANTGQELS